MAQRSLTLLNPKRSAKDYAFVGRQRRNITKETMFQKATVVILCLVLSWESLQVTANQWVPLVLDNITFATKEPYEVILSADHPVEYISSPGFPYEYYPPDIQLFYNIKIKLEDEVMQLSTLILMTFEMFALEESDYCHKDGFEIVDLSKKMRVFCGVQVGRTVLAEGSSLNIRFFTDSDVSSRGYSIRLEMYNTGCSSTFSMVNSGYFQSPNYPGRYYSNDLCVWKILAPEGKIIRAKFDKVFDIRAYEPLCVQDYLAVSRKGDFEKDVKRLCHGIQPDAIDSEGNIMLFVFRTDCCFEGKGFRVTFAVIDPIDIPVTTQQPPPPIGCSCGEENNEISRIVGGEIVDPPNRYPWVVGLINNRKSIFGGGALINAQYVLTASHCLERETTSSFKVLLGAHNVATSPSPVSVTELTMHPFYNNRTYTNDIGLIKLEKPVTMTQTVRPICLPTSNFNTDGVTAIVAGWGYDREGGKESENLNQVEVPVISVSSCIGKYGGVITEVNLCAGGEEDKDSCQGDSGGPLFVKREQKWFAVGISSWGIGCGREGYPGVYARVSEFSKWIEDQVNDAPPCDDVPPAIKPNLEDCGIPNKKTSERIVGGTETQPFEYPWMAMIVYNRTVEGVGALINPYYVLTAASVFDAWMEWYPEILDVFLGEHELGKREPFTQRYRVQSVLHHFQYGRPSPYNNDFALMKLVTPSEGVAERFRSICLPRSTVWYPEGSTLTAAGWGRTSTSGPGSNALMQVELDIVALQKCATIYPGWVTDRMICAYREGKDTCKGDSGAPLMKFYNGRYYLAGVSSWASKDGCALPGKPRVFSAVHKNLRWISENTGLSVE